MLGVAQRNPVLRSFGTSDAWLNVSHVEFQNFCVLGLRQTVSTPKTLSLRIGLHKSDLLRIPAGEMQIADGLFVDRENRAGTAELRRHIAQGCAVGEG